MSFANGSLLSPWKERVQSIFLASPSSTASVNASSLLPPVPPLLLLLVLPFVLLLLLVVVLGLSERPVSDIFVVVGFCDGDGGGDRGEDEGEGEKASCFELVWFVVIERRLLP